MLTAQGGISRLDWAIFGDCLEDGKFYCVKLEHDVSIDLKKLFTQGDSIHLKGVFVLYKMTCLYVKLQSGCLGGHLQLVQNSSVLTVTNLS